MQVKRSDGSYQNVSLDKILARISKLCKTYKLFRIDEFTLAKEAISRLYNGITTAEIDNFVAIHCSEKICVDPQYDKLSIGFCIGRLHKVTKADYMETTNNLYYNYDVNGLQYSLINDEYYNFVKEHILVIQKALDYDKDYNFDYFGYKTLENKYLSKATTKEGVTRIIERPQHIFMRVALSLNMDSIKNAIKTYKYLSQRCFIFGSPTLYNAGMRTQQLASCFLIHVSDDLEDMFNKIKNISQISKQAGGLSVNLSNIRAIGSKIRSTGGISKGLYPYIEIIQNVADYINQGGRRNGSAAVYLEPWHAEIYEFCGMRRNTGDQSKKCRNLFYALWICDLFMKRVQEDSYWSLMCPDMCPGLTTSFGKEFEELYVKYEEEKRYIKQVKAKELFMLILESQIETGMPYMLYKDNVNKKNNQHHIGTIQSSNLCAEIVEYTNRDEIAVCSLSSICLPSFYNKETKEMDYAKLKDVAGIVTMNLDNSVDINVYPCKETSYSHLKHRPLGIGVQGLADLYILMGLEYDSLQAREVNRKIFETIYFGALSKSCELAKLKGAYSTYEGSHFSEGLFQWNLWNKTKDYMLMDYDWDTLRNRIKRYGIRNSLLTTIMPTASTSQIMGFSEYTEPITSNLYTRSTMSGKFLIINKYLIEKLIELNIWNEKIKQKLIKYNGSIQNINEIPDDIKRIFKTTYEIGNRAIIDQSIERGPFIDQTQSLNLFMDIPDYTKLLTAHFYGWSNGLKTGMYYLKTKPAINGIKFGIDVDENEQENNNNMEICFRERQNDSDDDNFGICTNGSCTG